MENAILHADCFGYIKIINVPKYVTLDLTHGMSKRFV